MTNMNNTTHWERPLQKIGLAITLGILLVGGSFLAAEFTQSSESLFSLTPKVQTGMEIPEMDIIPVSKLYAFHATIYTVWATMLLSLPAFCTVWFIRKSSTAATYWLAFWTVGLVAMLVHLYMSMGALFEWNWPHILKNTVRVTIPIPDLVLTVWWTVDVALAWWLLHSRGALLHGQRLLLHVALLVIFLIGFIREGEITLSKIIGIVSALVVVGAVITGWMRVRSNPEKLKPPSA